MNDCIEGCVGACERVSVCVPMTRADLVVNGCLEAVCVVCFPVQQGGPPGWNAHFVCRSVRVRVHVQVASALALVHVDASKAGVPDAPLSKEAFVKLAHAALASQRVL